MKNEFRISYGCYLACSNSEIKYQLHHIWDCGLTGAGISGLGQSEYSLCRKVLSYENHLYVQDLPLSMAKNFFSPVIMEELPLKFCQECLNKLYEYIELNNIKRIPND